MRRTILVVSMLLFGLSACVSDKFSDYGVMIRDVGVEILTGPSATKGDLQAQARLFAEQMDGNNKLAPKNNKYSKRLQKLTSGLTQVDGTPLNFGVYLAGDINAFAMPDGTIRVYSGLMDVMHDDELLAVIGHEIGHIKYEHSLKQFKTTSLSQAAIKLASTFGDKAEKYANSDITEMGMKFISAQFSQQDELQSDLYSIEVLCQLKRDPYAALRAQEVLLKKVGSNGGLFATHPSSAERINQALAAAGNAPCR